MNAQIVGNIGLYFVCYELSKRGWNVMPTARNAKGVDIIAYNASGTRYIGIQVKSLRKKVPIPLGDSLEKVMGDFWVIVNNLEGTPGIFIMKPKEVISFAHRGEKDDRVSYWLQPKKYMVPEFESRWDRIEEEDENSAQKECMIEKEDDFYLRIMKRGVAILVRTISWPTPESPVEKMDIVGKIEFSSANFGEELQTIIKKTKADKKYFGFCRNCERLILNGQMHDSDNCQSCTEKKGIVY